MEKVELFLMRRQKGITLKMVSEHVDCSISLLSLWETNKANMDVNKQVLYREFIESF